MPGPFHNALEPQALWGRDDYNLPDTDFEDYMDNDAALSTTMEQLRTHGLVFVTGIPDKEDALTHIAKRMGPMKDTFYGYTWDGEWIDWKFRGTTTLTLQCSAHRPERHQRCIHIAES